MSTFDDLLVHANRLLDQRQDPFDDHVFCTRLAESPEAMEEVVRLRAALLHVEQGGRQNKRRPTLWWVGGLVAAALLMVMLPLEEQETASLSAKPQVSIPTSSKSAAMNFRIKTESTHLNPNLNSSQFHVAVVTFRVSS